MVVLEFSGDVSRLIMVYQDLDYIKSNNFTNLKPYLKLSSVFDRYEQVRFSSINKDNFLQKDWEKEKKYFYFYVVLSIM